MGSVRLKRTGDVLKYRNGFFIHRRYDQHPGSSRDFPLTMPWCVMRDALGPAWYIIIDDPMTPGDARSAAKRKSTLEWIDTTLPSRLDDKQRGIFILVMQRIHVDDVAAHLIAKGGWEVLEIPAIADVETTYDLGYGRTHKPCRGGPLRPLKCGKRSAHIE
jgi:hypothetical protein